MIKRIRSLIFGTSLPAHNDAGGDDAEATAVALLVEAALIDGQFDDKERATISELLTDRFGLLQPDVEVLIDDAQAASLRAVELYGFARRAKDTFDHEGRVELIEMLWQVIYADGIVDDYEANLVRRLTGLLHVSDRESGDARKRVVERLDIAS